MKLVKSFAVASTILISIGLPNGASAAGPAVTINPASLTFGTANPAGPYPTQSAVVVNSGDAPLILSNITVENPSPGSGADFSQANNCYPFPRTLTPGQSCTIQFGFFPGAFGVRQGAILIADNAPGSQHRLSLVGYAYPFKAIYTLDAFGGLHPANPVSPSMTGGPYWPGWKIARAAAMLSDGTGGDTLDGFGGLHPFAVGSSQLPLAITDNAYWPGWSIARDFDLFSNSTAATAAGYTLDGYGGAHAFGFTQAAPYSGSYWPNFDIARSIRLDPTSTTATPFGWTMEGCGGVHIFNGAQYLPTGAYWNADLAVELVVVR